MSFLSSALQGLPAIAAHPLAIAAYVATVIAWVIIALRVKRLKVLLGSIAQIPAQERPKVILHETGGIPLPASISPEQWLRARKHRFLFQGFVISVVLGALLLAWAGLESHDSVGSADISSADELVAELRNKEKDIHVLFEKWMNADKDNKNAFATEVVTAAPALINEYVLIDDTQFSSPKFAIERYQRIAALHSYMAGVLLDSSDRVVDATSHAKDEVLSASKGLDLGNRLKSRAREHDRVVTDALNYYLRELPNEEQILQWYVANGLAILAANGVSSSPLSGKALLAEAIAAVGAVSFVFPHENDRSMKWVMQQMTARTGDLH